MRMKIPEWLKFLCVGLVAVQIAFSPVIYLAILNSFGPSTQYRNPQLGNYERGPDGRNYVYLGEEFYVWITVIRHRINGNCLFDIERYAEVVSGPEKGRRYLISTAQLQFIGQNELRRTRWPVPEAAYYLGYAVNKQNEPQYDQPLLPAGVEEREFDFFVIGRYYCNFLDHIIPRYIQGGDTGDETERVRAVLKRERT